MLYTEIKRCRICGNQNFQTIIDMGTMALTGVFPSPGEAVESSPVELVRCSGNGNDVCGLVQLRHTYDIEKLYGDNYGYRSGLNSSMVEHLKGIVSDICRRVELHAGDLIIDIASNDGTLLSAYSSNVGLRLVGIDPTADKFKQYYPSHISFIPQFFSRATVQEKLGQKARVISSIAMFYDLENPIDFVQQIYDCLTDDGIWVFEQSYLPSMIKNTSYDTICHEHLEYYSLKQIKWLMDKVGFKIIDVQFNAANGGSSRIIVAKNNSNFSECTSLIENILKKEEEEGYHAQDVFTEFKNKIIAHKEELLNFIAQARANGKVIFGYGASTKGNVILQYCGLTANEIPFIAEVNDFKFGRVTPGSNIPIISEHEARSQRPDHFMVLPWHFKESILKRETEYLQAGGKLFFPLPLLEVL